MSARFGLVFAVVVGVVPVTAAYDATARGSTPPPWSQPLRFRALPGWSTGRSGTVRHFRNENGTLHRLSYPESSAWISSVPYRDFATTDPPARTVRGMPRRGIVVWAVVTPLRPADSAEPLDLRLAGFHRALCCDGTAPPPTRVWDTAGRSASGRYDVLVRVYFGSAPSTAMLRTADRALHALVLPRPRR